MSRHCAKCGSVNFIHRHHITYEPEELIDLCKHCHMIVTNINTLVARNYNEQKALSNEQRHNIHKFFMDNEKWILKSIVAPKLLLLERKKSGKKKKPKKNKKKSKHWIIQDERKWFGWYKPPIDVK